jgi:hypothetical protein
MDIWCGGGGIITLGPIEGLFKPLVMFFGLMNSPATFQTMMNNLFQKEITEGWAIIYMDNMVVHPKTLCKHKKYVSQILWILTA